MAVLGRYFKIEYLSLKHSAKQHSSRTVRKRRNDPQPTERSPARAITSGLTRGAQRPRHVDVRGREAISRTAARRRAADIEGRRSPAPFCRSNCQPTIQERIPGGVQIKWTSSQFKHS